jgi:phosphate transport system substrate-binding protein
VHRSDGSGTSFVFTDYLAKVSADWKAQVGAGKSVNWPKGLGGKGNEGVTQQVKQVEGSLGYVELVYALSNGMPAASVKNANGDVVAPTLESISTAAGGINFPQDTDFRVSITNSPGAGAYPIASFTWLLVRPTMPDTAKARALHDFLDWMLTPEAMAMASELHYAPLPTPVIDLLKVRLAGLK